MNKRQNEIGLSVWTAQGGFMSLLAKPQWGMKQITAYAEQQAWPGAVVIRIELFELGNRSAPLQSFARNGNGKWTTIAPKPWPKEEWDAFNKFLSDAVEAAAAEFHE